MREDKHEFPFPGFPSGPKANYWQYPKALNGWWSMITGSEQKCLDYILRHTRGYKKNADAISYSQFINGIKRLDGVVVDKGTGIKNEKTIRKALKGLVQKGFISRTDRSEIGKEPVYSLNIVPNNTEDPLPSVGTPGQPIKDTSPYQKVVPTINTTIDKDNTNSAAQTPNNSVNTDMAFLIEHLSSKHGGVTFPNHGKQAKYIKTMFDSGYTVSDILWAVDQLAVDKWWSEKGFDFKNVSDQIPQLLFRHKRTPKEIGKPNFISCNQNGCDGGYVSRMGNSMVVHECRMKYEEELKKWKDQYNK